MGGSSTGPALGAETIDEQLDAACPACGAEPLAGFYRQRGVPSHSCLLLDSLAEAEQFPRGTITLGFCRSCGFIANADVDPDLQAYSSSYEETQGFSPRFRRFARELARELVERHDLRDKTVLEIGCGKGEFLVDLCELGDNRGIGVDPAVVPERVAPAAADRIEFVADYWSERYAQLTGDAVICRHTLEHIPGTGEFLRLLRDTIGDRKDTLVFFEVPDATRVLAEPAFWDIYYEHCSYFTPGALARQFRSTGFRPTRLWRAFDDQYALIECLPASHEGDLGTPMKLEERPGDVARHVERFRVAVNDALATWRERIDAWRDDGKEIVIWGSGSKGVAFLTTLGIEAEIRRAVDINPYKHGKFMAGTGQEIVAPDSLHSAPPDVIIAMNPVYREEIATNLRQLGVSAELLAV